MIPEARWICQLGDVESTYGFAGSMTCAAVACQERLRLGVGEFGGLRRANGCGKNEKDSGTGLHERHPSYSTTHSKAEVMV
jgi:hypothetical protein